MFKIIFGTLKYFFIFKFFRNSSTPKYDFREKKIFFFWFGNRGRANFCLKYKKKKNNQENLNFLNYFINSFSYLSLISYRLL